jgi:hypothetical protein
MKNHPFSFYAKASVYYPQNRPLLKTRSRNHNFAVNHPFLLRGVNELSSRVRKRPRFFYCAFSREQIRNFVPPIVFPRSRAVAQSEWDYDKIYTAEIEK